VVAVVGASFAFGQRLARAEALPRPAARAVGGL